MSTRISEFLGQSIIPSNAYLTYIVDGTNYKISFSDYLSSVGASGTLSQAGDLLATPILNKSGADNQIRNIEDGAGIKAVVSPQNGVRLDHSFTQDATGIPLLTAISSAQPVIRSITAGAGITLTVTGDNIVISSP